MGCVGHGRCGSSSRPSMLRGAREITRWMATADSSMLVPHNVTVPHRRSPSTAPSEEPEYAAAQAYCDRHNLPFYCEHEFEWGAERVNATHIRVALGNTQSWIVGGMRGCDVNALPSRR
eukprot:3407509-Prymnesium_polylepis.1